MIQYAFSPPVPSRIGDETIDLSKNTQVISNEELKSAWTTNNGSTLFFYINPSINDRTSISGNEYANAVEIGSKQVLQILIAADAGRGYSSAPARLKVVLKDKSDDEAEYIDIQNLPLQRWSAVAIVKEGRKFNIYINGRLSVSHVCDGMPDFDQTQPLRVGNERLGGAIALMSLSPYPIGIDSIHSLVSSTSSTDGSPYLSSGFGSFIPSFNLSSLSFCPGGNCNSTKISGNPGPMSQWSSPYA